MLSALYYNVLIIYLSLLLLLGEMESTALQKSEMKLTKGKLLQTLKTLEKEFVIQLEYKHTDIENGKITNIIHFTTRDDTGIIGYRIPAVFAKPEGIVFRFDGIATTHPHVPLNLKIWMKIRIQQVKDKSGNYVYSIFVDDVLKHSDNNVDPQRFHHVNVYASDAWHDEVKDAYLREFEIFRKYRETRMFSCSLEKYKGYVKEIRHFLYQG